MKKLYLIDVLCDENNVCRYNIMTPDGEFIYQGCDYETARTYIEHGELF